MGPWWLEKNILNQQWVDALSPWILEHLRRALEKGGEEQCLQIFNRRSRSCAIKNKSGVADCSSLQPFKQFVSWLPSKLTPGSFFLKWDQLENHLPVASVGFTAALTWCLLSVCSVLILGHTEVFPSSVGHRSVHYVLDASLVPCWASLFLEPKLAPRMETNGKRMCAWVHSVLFMLVGTWHVARIRIFSFNVNSSSSKRIVWIEDENQGLEKRETCSKKQHASVISDSGILCIAFLWKRKAARLALRRLGEWVKHWLLGKPFLIEW